MYQEYTHLHEGRQPEPVIICGMKRLFAMLAIAALLGQGCFAVTGTVPSTESNVSAPEGFTAFRKGFGSLPGPSPFARPDSASLPNITWKERPPAVSNEVTVLRQAPTIPGALLLQNLTTALRIPAGTLEANPSVQSLTTSWKDESGFLWSYNASTGAVAFEHMDGQGPLTVPSLPDDERIVNAAQAFFRSRGIGQQGWGEPTLAFSWNSWWFNESKNGTCMTQASVAAIQSIARAELPILSGTPQLPLRSHAACVKEEFPNIQTVEFHLTKDAQDVFNRMGARVTGARVFVRASDMSVIRGWFLLDQDVERSNYPAITSEDLTAQLLLGGVGGFGELPRNASVEFTKFETGLYAHQASTDGIPRTFYLPAIRALGSIAVENAINAFVVIVPLVREDQYARKE